MAQWNAQGYMSALLPQYEFLGKGKPPKTLEDWKGLRVRAGGGLGDAMARLGAVLSTVSATETYTAIERGTVDAVSFPFTYAHASYQIHTVTNWFTSNLSPGTAECDSVINKDAYAKLPPAYQKLLADAKEPAYAALIKAYVDIDKVNLPLFKSKLTEIVYSDADLVKFQQVAGKPVWDKWIADNKGKFDSQSVFDTLARRSRRPEAKYEKKSSASQSGGRSLPRLLQSPGLSLRLTPLSLRGTNGTRLGVTRPGGGALGALDRSVIRVEKFTALLSGLGIFGLMLIGVVQIFGRKFFNCRSSATSTSSRSPCRCWCSSALPIPSGSAATSAWS